MLQRDPQRRNTAGERSEDAPSVELAVREEAVLVDVVFAGEEIAVEQRRQSNDNAVTDGAATHLRIMSSLFFMATMRSFERSMNLYSSSVRAPFVSGA